MNSDQQISPAGRGLIALALVAAGVLPISAAFDLGPMFRETGRWPRNESFIARMKARRNTDAPVARASAGEMPIIDQPNRKDAP